MYPYIRLLLITSATFLAWPETLVRADYPVHRPVRAVPAPELSHFTIHPDQPRQVIKGLGFEIQSDSINSGNAGMPEDISGVPHDLIPSERQRFYQEMLHGFRYCRLAAGLYWRGLTPDKKQFEGRWPDQASEIREMIQNAGIEGVSFEYWSPAPFWKASGKLEGRVPGTELRCFGNDFAQDPVYHGDVARFLSDFAQACRGDLQTLRDANIPISMWGLQNEPVANTPYASCVYTPAEYSRTFSAVAPVIRAFDPKIWITADDWNISYIKPALADPATSALIDAFVIHEIGSDSIWVKGPRTPKGFSQPSYQNEYEYLSGPASPDRCLNTVQHIMNWFQLGEAPTWFWIHALKPVGNQEASGYALGFWRPPDYEGKIPPGFESLQPGHWTWNKYNWNAVVGFLHHMPWNSRDVTVNEEKKDGDLRILSFKRPDGKLVLVVSNRCGALHHFNIDTGIENGTFQGWRYTPDDVGADGQGEKLGALEGETIEPTVPDRAWEFWEQQ